MVINPVIVHGMPGIISLIITIFLTLLCFSLSKYPLHILEEKSDAYLNSRHKNWLLTKNIKERLFLFALNRIFADLNALWWIIYSDFNWSVTSIFLKVSGKTNCFNY